MVVTVQSHWLNLVLTTITGHSLGQTLGVPVTAPVVY